MTQRSKETSFTNPHSWQPQGKLADPSCVAELDLGGGGATSVSDDGALWAAELPSSPKAAGSGSDGSGDGLLGAASRGAASPLGASFGTLLTGPAAATAAIARQKSSSSSISPASSSSGSSQ